MKPALAFVFSFAVAAHSQSFVAQMSGTEVSLRGVSAVSDSVAWASGQNGTFLRTLDGGAKWEVGRLPDAADVDLRGVRAFDDKTAYLLGAGPGRMSRIYKTSNGGSSWSLQIVNPDKDGFWDCVAFWDATHGIVVGDPVAGRFAILTTKDGVAWRRIKGPPAQAMEGLFAASNTCVAVRGAREAWFATGGVGGGRVFHSTDGGETWTAVKTPVRHDAPSAGIFSLTFNGSMGIAVGGDYMKTTEGSNAALITEDGGKSWADLPGASGYRSAVAFAEDLKLWVAVGPNGSEVSSDGRRWRSIDTAPYHAVSFSSSTGWAVGPNGAIGRFMPISR